MRALPLLLSLLAGSVWAQEPVDALPEVSRRLYVEGQDLQARGALSEAAVRYRSVIRREPDWVQARLALGQVLELGNDLSGAEQAYLGAPYNGDCIEALGRLYMGQERWEDAARQFESLRDAKAGTSAPLVLEAAAKARLDPHEAMDVLLEYLDRPAARLGRADAMDAVTAVARGLREDGDGDGARDMVAVAMERLDAEGIRDDDPVREALNAFAERFELEDEARRLAQAANRPLTPEQRERLARARDHHIAGELEAAETVLDALVEDVPDNADVWGLLSDVRLSRGDVRGADIAAMRAEQLDPLDPRNPARVGELLFRHYGGRHDGEAADAYRRALSSPNSNPELWFDCALAELRAGRKVRAMESLNEYLARRPDGPHAAHARELVAGRDRFRPEPPAAARVPERPPELTPELWDSYWIARVLVRPPRGSPEDLQSASAELAPVRAAAPDYVGAINLEAQIALLESDRARALELYQQSLEIDREQGVVLQLVAEILSDQGREGEAEQYLTRAAAQGAPSALVLLARADFEAGRPWAARERLAAYFRSPARDIGSDEERDAIRLQERIERLFNGALVAAGGLGLLAIAVPLGLRTRRRGGVGLRTLLDRSPSVWPDVARILSAIRHEVLKHHTTILPAVAWELEVGDPELGAWAADRLTGAIARFRGYIRDLELLGRLQGIRLNLRHRDPDLGPVVVAMDRLAALEPDLRAGSIKIIEPLRELSETLNERGYRAIGALLRRLCLLPLDARILDEVWEGVRRELRAEDVHFEVDLPDERVLLRIFRDELDDILTNVLRNAAEATLAGSIDPAPRVGIRVRVDADDITGLERVAIRVVDTAQGRISTAMIRGRYIGRGLGLAVDLISRNGGSVHVEEEPGWAKAVVIRLPRAEASDLEDDA